MTRNYLFDKLSHQRGHKIEFVSYGDWDDLETEESFLSGYLDGSTFYFGGVVDYHY